MLNFICWSGGEVKGEPSESNDGSLTLYWEQSGDDVMIWYFDGFVTIRRLYKFKQWSSKKQKRLQFHCVKEGLKNVAGSLLATFEVICNGSRLLNWGFCAEQSDSFAMNTKCPSFFKGLEV